MVNELLVKAYAVNIYRYANRTFATIPANYREPVMAYAGNNFSLELIDEALVKGRITEEEYNQTLSLITV